MACFQLLMRQFGPVVALPLFINGKLTPFLSKLITKISASAIFKIDVKSLHFI